MPREIITLQAGQCGNQSKPKSNFIVSSGHHLKQIVAPQSVKNFGVHCAQSTALAQTERWRSLLQRAEIGKTSSSIRHVLKMSIGECI